MRAASIGGAVFLLYGIGAAMTSTVASVVFDVLTDPTVYGQAVVLGKFVQLKAFPPNPPSVKPNVARSEMKPPVFAKSD